MQTAVEDTATWVQASPEVWSIKRTINKEFQSQGTRRGHISYIMDSLIKCLGKWYDFCLKDSNNIQRFNYQFQEGLKHTDQTGLPGKKQNMAIPAWTPTKTDVAFHAYCDNNFNS